MLYEIQSYSHVERNPLVDEFRTPYGLIAQAAILARRHWRKDYPLRLLDPGANDGRWGEVFRIFFPLAHIVGIEIMDMIAKQGIYDEYHVTDFLSWTTEEKFDGFIGNPPYSLYLRTNDDGDPIRDSVAEQFVVHSLSQMKPRFYGYQLLRDGFLYSRERADGIHKQHHYHEAFHLNPRPSFGAEDARVEFHPGKKNTNAYNYVLVQWDWLWKLDHGKSRELAWEYVGIEAIKELEQTLPNVYSNYDLIDSYHRVADSFGRTI